MQGPADRVKVALKDNGCFCPEICSRFPYSCGCGYLVRCRYDTLEAIERLRQGLQIGSERPTPNVGE